MKLIPGVSIQVQANLCTGLGLIGSIKFLLITQGISDQMLNKQMVAYNLKILILFCPYR